MKRTAIVAAALLWALPAAAAPRAASSARLFEGLEGAKLVAVGQVRDVRPLDAQGLAAVLDVEAVLAGLPEEAPAPATLAFAWEELAAEREPRFRNGERVLLALVPLPGVTLWRTRIPEPEARLHTWGIALAGDAFLRDPSTGSVQLLEHYLALPPDARSGADGARHLAALAAGSETPLARAAIERLAAVRQLDEGGAKLVVQALRRAGDEPGLAAPLLVWIGASRPVGLAPALDTAIAAAPEPAPILLAARGALAGELDASRSAFLLARTDAEERRIGVEYAPKALTPRLEKLLRDDPSPEVRTAAITRLVALGGADALEPVLGALEDPDRDVRNRAALALADVGDPAVPRLSDVAFGWPEPGPQSAVFALRVLNRPAARAVLQDIHERHPDPGLRTLAGIALGGPIGEVD